MPAEDHPRSQFATDPAWIVGLPVIAFSAIVLVALTTAMFGVLSVPLVIALTIVVGLAAARLLPSETVVAGSSTPAAVWTVLLISMAVLATWNVAHASELVLTGRDGATYLNIAKSLVEGSDLSPDLVKDPFVGSAGYQYASPGWEMRSDGSAYPQFLHAAPAVWALAGRLSGDTGLIGANAVVGAIGLWVMFGLMRRWLQPWTALGAVLMFGLSLPMVYFARSTFAEPASLVLLWGGVWLAAAAFESRDAGPGLARLAGFAMGLVFATRLDGWLYGLAIAIAGLWWKGRRDSEGDKVFERIWQGFLVAAMVGAADLLLFSLPYLGSHRTLLLPLIVGSVLARMLASSGATKLRHRMADRFNERSGAFDRLAAAGFVLFAMVVLIVRPLFTESYGGSYGLSGAEVAAGLPTGTGRDYVEFAGWWPAWYLGWPAVALSLVGAFQAIRSGGWRRTPLAVLVTSVLIIGGGVYIFAPSANPDHIWVMRRFLPVVLPVVAATVWVIGERLWAERRPWSRLGAIAAVATTLVAVASVTMPLASATDNAESLVMIGRLCDHIDGRPVLFVREGVVSTIAFVEPVRQWCEVPVAAVDIADLPDAVQSLSTPVLVLAATPQGVEWLTMDPSTFTASITYIESTLFEAPYFESEATFHLYGAIVDA